MADGRRATTTRTTRGRLAALGLVAATVLVGCTVGPNYVRPSVEVPPAYKETEGWKVAQPDDGAVRGDWWEVFGDTELDALESRVDASNQAVAAAEALVRESRALVQETRAAFFPTVTVGLGVTRARQVVGTSNSSATTDRTVTALLLPADVSWEIDLWGRVRRAVEGSEASAQASLADL